MTTCLGKGCSFDLRVSCVNVYEFVFVLLSLLVFRVGCGIRAYLIIAILFALQTKTYKM